MRFALHHADERKLAIRMGHVHAEPDHELIRTLKTDELGINRNRTFTGFFQENCGENPARPAGCQEILGKSQRATRFENVVDEQDIATTDIALDIAQDRHLTG